MKERMTKEEAWRWVNERPWLTGCNYVPSQTPGLSLWQKDTMEEILPSVKRELDLIRDLGMNTVRMWVPFELWFHEREELFDRMDYVLSLLHERGISLMPVVHNDCVNFGRPKKIEIPYPRGRQNWDVGYHGGHANNPFGEIPPVDPSLPEKDRFFSDKGWILWDEEEYVPVMLEYTHALFRRFGKDERIAVWDMWNEPGNSNRHGLSIPYLKAAFQAARSEDPIQPLTAGVWVFPEKYGIDPAVDQEDIGRVALDLSDLISFHCYTGFEDVKRIVGKLEEEGRPLLNTEWLNRLLGNFLFDQLPYYREKKIGSYFWGLVAGHSQHYLPWDNLKKNKDLDFTLWQHDLFRGNGKAYDPDEIELIKRINAAK